MNSRLHLRPLCLFPNLRVLCVKKHPLPAPDEHPMSIGADSSFNFQPGYPMRIAILSERSESKDLSGSTCSTHLPSRHSPLFTSFLFNHLRTLSRFSISHLFRFQPLPHSFAKTPGGGGRANMKIAEANHDGRKRAANRGCLAQGWPSCRPLLLNVECGSPAAAFGPASRRMRKAKRARHVVPLHRRRKNRVRKLAATLWFRRVRFLFLSWTFRAFLWACIRSRRFRGWPLWRCRRRGCRIL